MAEGSSDGASSSREGRRLAAICRKSRVSVRREPRLCNKLLLAAGLHGPHSAPDLGDTFARGRDLLPRADDFVNLRREGDLPLVIGHRGAAALAPENTLASLEAAVAAGVELVEFDVGAGLVLGHS